MGAFVALASVSTASPAAAETFTKDFDVQCTQGYVNGGNPFTVGVSAVIELPDTITVGQEVNANVSLDLELPSIVSDTITNYGYDTLEGLVDATVQVAEGSDVTDLTAQNFALPAISVTAGQPISIQTTPSFPTYTTMKEGQALVSFSGDFVTVHDVVVSNDTGGRFTLGAFNCSATEDVLIATVSVAPSTPTSMPSQTTAAPTTTAARTATTSASESAPASASATASQAAAAGSLADTGSSEGTAILFGLGLSLTLIGGLALRRSRGHR